jgi:Kef-type K+ transport system membrane component KefB/Trk K+ transport system NAD-binding subunit
MHQSPSYIALLIVLLLAFSVPLVLSWVKWLRLPVIVGEIIAGIIVGRSGLGLIGEQDPMLSLLAELGFVFLMFLAGMEIDFSNLRKSGVKRLPQGKRTWGPLGLGTIHFACTLLLSALIGIIFHRLGLTKNPWMMALILSTTSLGVVMPVLKEGRLIGGRLGQTILIAALIADFATMTLITVLVALVSTGLTFKILLIGVLFLAFFLLQHFGTLFINKVPGVRAAIGELSHASTQLKVRAAFTLMLIFVALSEALGAEMILGAFLAGAVVSLLRTADDAELGRKLEAIGFGFFIPIFFITVGLNFNLSALSASPKALLLAPLLLAAAILVKLAPALVFRLSFSWRESLAAGTLLSARLSLIIAASAIGMRLGIIDEPVNAAIILVSIVTVTLAPLIFARLAPRRQEPAPPIIVASAGELGLLVAARLQAHGERTVIVSSHPEGVEHARQRGLDAVVGDIDKNDPVLAPLLEKARAVICTSTDMAFNYQVCKLARTVYGIEHVVVEVNDPQERSRFEQLGALTLNPALDRVAMLVLLSRNPALYQLLTRTDDDKEVVEVVVRDPAIAGRPLRGLQLPGDLLILAVRRKGELLVPHGNTHLESRDQLTVVGSIEAIDAARRMFDMQIEGSLFKSAVK